MSNNLTQEELNKIQEMNTRFAKAKLALGDLELTKHDMLKEVDKLRLEFEENEKQLISKYGKDAVINMKTGEVTQKQ
jgi:wobble nucleotide-excising tRNase